MAHSASSFFATRSAEELRAVTLLVIADEIIELRCFLLRRVRSLLAQRVISLRGTNSVAIGGQADMRAAAPRLARALLTHNRHP
jgi:hypothetical protein